MTGTVTVTLRSTGSQHGPSFATRTSVNVSEGINELTDGMALSLNATRTRDEVHIANPDMKRKRSPAPWFVLAAAGLLCVLVVGGLVGKAAAQTRPEGEMRWALYVTLAPIWFDPGEIGGITSIWVLYAIHDALVKPMPGNLMAPSLAESWTVSADQRVYEFKLREGLRFHNGDPFTAEDVKFSFHRAKGSKVLHDKVREVEIVGPSRVRFHLHEPWPDFITFYGTLVSGAGWVVPKKYVE